MSLNTHRHPPCACRSACCPSPGSALLHTTTTLPSTALVHAGKLLWPLCEPPPPSPNSASLPRARLGLSQGHTVTLTLGIGCGHHTKLLLHTLLLMATSPVHLHAGLLSLPIQPGSAPACSAHHLPLCAPPTPLPSSFAPRCSAGWLFFSPFLLPGLILSSALKTQRLTSTPKTGPTLGWVCPGGLP